MDTTIAFILAVIAIAIGINERVERRELEVAVDRLRRKVFADDPGFDIGPDAAAQRAGGHGDSQ